MSAETCFKTDRDIPDRTWQHYLKKYQDRYRLFCDGCGIWQIKCKFGSIQLYSMVKGQLVFVADFMSAMRKTYFLKKLVKTRAFHFISQEGHADLCLVFNEKDLQNYVEICRCYHRKKLSQEHKQRLADRMRRLHAERKQRGKI